MQRGFWDISMNKKHPKLISGIPMKCKGEKMSVPTVETTQERGKDFPAEAKSG